MEKKKIVQIVIIIFAFGTAGYVLYNGFFKNDNKEALQSSLPPGATSSLKTPGQIPGAGAGVAAASSPEGILPYGDKLELSILKKQGLEPQNYTYPSLDAGKEVGIPEQNLIIAPSSSSPSQ